MCALRRDILYIVARLRARVCLYPFAHSILIAACILPCDVYIIIVLRTARELIRKPVERWSALMRAEDLFCNLLLGIPECDGCHLFVFTPGLKRVELLY